MVRSVNLTLEEIEYLFKTMDVYRMQGLRGAEAELANGLRIKLGEVLAGDEMGGWVEFDSSNLKMGRYDEDASRLDIEFTSGARWHYLDVPPSIWEGLQEAESKGKFFRAEILDLYVAVPEAEPGEEPGE